MGLSKKNKYVGIPKPEKVTRVLWICVVPLLRLTARAALLSPATPRYGARVYSVQCLCPKWVIYSSATQPFLRLFTYLLSHTVTRMFIDQNKIPSRVLCAGAAPVSKTHTSFCAHRPYNQCLVENMLDKVILKFPPEENIGEKSACLLDRQSLLGQDTESTNHKRKA